MRESHFSFSGAYIVHGQDESSKFEHRNPVGESRAFECANFVDNRITLQSDREGSAHARLARDVANMFSVNRGIETIDNELMPVNPELVQLLEAKEEQKRLRSLQNRHDQINTRIYSRRRPSLSASYLNDDDIEPDTSNFETRRHLKRQVDDDEMRDFIVDDDDQAEDFADDVESVISSSIDDEAEVNALHMVCKMKFLIFDHVFCRNILMTFPIAKVPCLYMSSLLNIISQTLSQKLFRVEHCLLKDSKGTWLIVTKKISSVLVQFLSQELQIMQCLTKHVQACSEDKHLLQSLGKVDDQCATPWPRLRRATGYGVALHVGRQLSVDDFDDE